MRIGVTGATGFIGAYLLRRLADRYDHRLKALTRTLSFDVQALPKRVDWQQGDLQSAKTCNDFLRDLDVLIHLAHTNTPLTSNQCLRSDISSNMLPIANIIQAIREQRNKPHVIYISSGGAIYGIASQNRMFKETDTCKPGTSYGIQKLIAEHYFRMAAEQEWLTATILRVGNPYGILLPPERKQGLIGVVLNQLAHNQHVTLFGSLDNVRDYLHLDDLCEIFDAALIPRTSFDVFNVGSGKGFSVRQVLQLVEQFSGREILKHYAPDETDTKHLPSWVVLDNEKARNLLSWTPVIELESGLQRLCKEIF